MPAEQVGAMTPLLDDARRREHKRRNQLQSALLVGGLGLVTAFSAWLIWSWTGVLVTLLWIATLYVFAPRLPPEMVMRMYRAQRIDPKNGGQIAYIVDELARRAGLPATPPLYVIPSMTLNAFATGTPDKAIIGITEGLLRRLSLRELAGVLAHELSHVRNNDLSVMALADAMTRFTQLLSYLALFLAIFNLPAMLLGDSDIPVLALLLLYLAPTIGSLLQLGLSRTREYDADLEGAQLTGDPRGLASALEKLERYQGHFWEDLTYPVPSRKIPQPSLLRSHPPTAQRVERLLALENRELAPPIEVVEEPMVSLVGMGPGSMQPRYRFPGVWF
jgi:heat shock protein HtpX